jgi:hypothetical protein
MDSHIADGGVQRTGRLGALEVLPPSAIAVWARDNRLSVEAARATTDTGAIFTGPWTVDCAWSIFAGA